MSPDYYSGLADVEKANIMAKEALEIAKDVKQDMNELNKKCQKIEHDNYLLKLKNKESYSKRDNLLIHGIVDDGSDDDNTCSRLTRDFFVQNLNISKHDADKIIFVRCLRVGKKSPTVKRPMIVRFQCYADRQLVWNTRWTLKCAVNTRVGVEWEQPLLTKCPNGYAPHTASDSKVLTLPSRGGTVSTNGERRKARHWRSNQLLWTDGVHQLKRQFI